jgi:hypothetical protein
MSNFKVGNKVICIDGSGQRYLKEGNEYTVSTPDGHKFFVDGYRRYSFLKARFKVINDFRIGDLVFIKDKHFTELWYVTNILEDGRIGLKTASHGWPVPENCWEMHYGLSNTIQHATLSEIKNGCRS